MRHHLRLTKHTCIFHLSSIYPHPAGHPPGSGTEPPSISLNRSENIHT